MSPDTFKKRFGGGRGEGQETPHPRRYPWCEALSVTSLGHPGAREKKQLLLEAMERKEDPFSIVGDIKKAHRRFKNLAEEHGFLASAGLPRWPRRAIFGVNCASYWWTRIAAVGSGPPATC